MMLFYNILLTGVILPLIPFWAVSEKRKKLFRQRIGLRLPNIPRKREPTLWVHALSVGEVISAIPLVKHLRAQYPDAMLLFSASTRTGFSIAEQRLGEVADGIFPFPLDLIFSVRRVVRHIAPDLVILVETDIWPNFLHEMEKRKVPVLLVNGRLSDKSFKGYKRLSPFSDRIFGKFSHICAQSPEDRRRFRRLGVLPERLTWVGSLKFEGEIRAIPDVGLRKIRKTLFIPDHRRIIVAGSTHPGEEAMLAQAFFKLKKREKDLSLILVPRNPDRADEILSIFEGSNFNAVRYQDLLQGKAPSQASDVVVIDLIGLLKDLYAVADIAFVGGSLVPFGGHNPLEPAGFAVPVFFGPHMGSFREISKMLLSAGGALQVRDEDELYRSFSGLFNDEQRREAQGLRARGVLEKNRGALSKTLDLIRGFLRASL